MAIIGVYILLALTLALLASLPGWSVLLRILVGSVSGHRQWRQPFERVPLPVPASRRSAGFPRCTPSRDPPGIVLPAIVAPDVDDGRRQQRT